MFDVVVVGGGPAGCAAAAAASRLGRTVALLQSDPRTTFRIGEGAGPGTSQLIDEIFGAETKAFSPDAHVRCPSIVSSWGQSTPTVADHMLNPLGHAWNLDRDRFDADLQGATERLGVDLRRGARVTTARRDDAVWTIAPARAPSLRARVLVDAGGRSARVARRQGARKRHLDRLVALWAVWAVDECDRSSSTYVEAVPRGWWYSVLLPGRRRMVMHLTDADLLPSGRRERIDLAESATDLEVIGSVLGTSRAPRIVFGPEVCSARSGWLDRFGGTAWLSAGDAACTFDPLSGRGIVVALLTGRTAGRAAASLLAGEDRHEVDRHHDGLAALLADGLSERTDAYRAEMRWPEEEFWSRRHQPPDQIWETSSTVLEANRFG